MDVFQRSLSTTSLFAKPLPQIWGDFSGGVVDINKGISRQEQPNVKLGLGYNTNTSFNKNFLTHDGGKLDWMGIDDSRALPSSYDYGY